MPRTPEERAAINRRNASQSTGPKTAEGKAASRRNSTKHGLRAEALALPNEDPTAVAARSGSWNDYYRPQSPAAQHLVNACVAATLLSDRCQRYHEAALTKQVRDAVSAWDSEQEDALRAAVALLPTDPAAAVRKLNRTGLGCEWLANRWVALIAALDERGYWTGTERTEALQLQGLHPLGAGGKLDPEAWLQILYSAGCVEPETRSDALLDWVFDPHRVPADYQGEYDRDDLAPPDVYRGVLRRIAAAELAAARAREADHAADNRAAAADRASILHDGPSARLFLRYHAEARTAFTRAYGSLVKALDRDAAETETETDDLSPNEANFAPADPPTPPALAVSPNEADPETPTEADPADLPIPAPGEDPLFDLLLEACGGPTRTAGTSPNDAPKPARERLVG